jgi:DNA-binding phage protein
MALTRHFKVTVKARLERDPAFREALLAEAVNAWLGGERAIANTLLRDLINATLGFERLAAKVKKPSKSLHRMLARNGNPNTANFQAILSVLQKETGVRLQVRAS